MKLNAETRRRGGAEEYKNKKKIHRKYAMYFFLFFVFLRVSASPRLRVLPLAATLRFCVLPLTATLRLRVLPITTTLRFCVLPLAAILFFIFSVDAQQDDVAMRQARIFFEAGDIPQAVSQYRIMLEEDLPIWKQAVIYYDIGTAFLVDGQWEEALSAFQKSADLNVHLRNLPLGERLATNTALAYLLQAKSFVEQTLTPSSSQREENEYVTGIILIYQVLDRIKLARVALCRLAEAEGAVECPSSWELDEMYREAKNLQALLLDRFQQFLVTESSMEDKLTILLFGMQRLSLESALPMQFSLEDSMQHKYSRLYLSEGESWRSMWRALRDDIIKGKKAPAVMSKFDEAEKSYASALASLAGRHFKQSQQELESSIKALQDLSETIFQSGNLELAVDRILLQYSLALAQNPLLDWTLEKLASGQEAISQNIKALDSKKISEEFEQAQHLLSIAKEALGKEGTVYAQFLLSGAKGAVMHIKYLLETSKKQRPKNILKATITEEELAVDMGRLAQQLVKRSDNAAEINTLLLKMQTKVLDSAADFLPAVLIEQTHDFQENKPQPSWDDVIALFVEGQTAAHHAKDLLDNPFSKYDSIYDLQRISLEKWKEALKKLEDTKRESKSKSQSQEQTSAENSPDAPPAQSKVQSNKEKSITNVIRALQEMEADDRSHSELQNVPVNKQVERPW